MAASASVLASCPKLQVFVIWSCTRAEACSSLTKFEQCNTLAELCVWRGLIVLFLLLFLETLPSLRCCVLPISSIASLHFISGIMVKKTKKNKTCTDSSISFSTVVISFLTVYCLHLASASFLDYWKRQYYNIYDRYQYNILASSYFSVLVLY